MRGEIEYIDIFEYDDLLDFLKTYNSIKQQKSRYWSLSLWAKKVGLGATSSLSMVLKGKRSIGKGMAQKFITYFGLNEQETKHFRKLIDLNKIKRDPKLAVYLGTDAPKTPSNSTTRPLIVNWLTYAIREMTLLKDFEEDPEWIQKRLWHPVDINEIKSILKQLEEKQLLVRNDVGQLRPSERTEYGNNEITFDHIQSFHKEVLQIADKGLSESDGNSRSMQVNTYSLQGQDIPKVKDLIQEFQSKVSKIVTQKEGDGLYQLNIQFFPLDKT